MQFGDTGLFASASSLTGVNMLADADGQPYAFERAMAWSAPAPSPVPVPAAFWLFGSALAGFGLIGARHRGADRRPVA